MGSGKGQAKRIKSSSLAFVAPVKNMETLKLIRDKSFVADYKSANLIKQEEGLVRMIASLLGEVEGSGVDFDLNRSYGSNTNSSGHVLSYADGHTSLFTSNGGGYGYNRGSLYCDCDKGEEGKICLHQLAHASYKFVLDAETSDKEMPVLDLIKNLQNSSSLEEVTDLTNEVANGISGYLEKRSKGLDKYLSAIRSNKTDINSPQEAISLINEKGIVKLDEEKTFDYSIFVDELKNKDRGESLHEVLANVDRSNKAKVAMFKDKKDNSSYRGFNKIVSGGIAKHYGKNSNISFQKKTNGDGLLIIKTSEDTTVANYSAVTKEISTTIISYSGTEEEKNNAQKYAAAFYPLIARISDEQEAHGAYKPFTDNFRKALGKYHDDDGTKNGKGAANMMGIGEMTGLVQQAAEAYPADKITINKSAEMLNNWVETIYDHIDLNPPKKIKAANINF